MYRQKMVHGPRLFPGAGLGFSEFNETALPSRLLSPSKLGAVQFLVLAMSALGGGLNGSTQHFISDVSDGVRVEDIFEDSGRWPRSSCGAAAGTFSQFN